MSEIPKEIEKELLNDVFENNTSPEEIISKTWQEAKKESLKDCLELIDKFFENKKNVDLIEFY